MLFLLLYALIYLYFIILMLVKILKKKTGIVGFITGIIGLVITTVYVCYNGYIFNNDIAFSEYNIDNNVYDNSHIEKLYSNGAKYKFDTNKYITIYANEKEDFSQYIKFKDLGQKQYNYDSKYYKTYYEEKNGNNYCTDLTKYTETTKYQNCDYLYEVPYTNFENKDLYDRWLTTLVLGVIIVLCNIGILIFGFLLFKSGGGNSNEVQTVPII